MKDKLQAIGFALTVGFATIGLGVVLSAAIRGIPFNTMFTYDYIEANQTILEKKVLHFDSLSVANMGDPVSRHRYLDSADKYMAILDYIQLPK